MEGIRYWLIGKYGESLQTFLEAESPEKLLDMLSDWASKALHSECDLIGVCAVLLYV